MNISFLVIVVLTLALTYLSMHSQTILSLLFGTIAFFMLLLSFVLAPSILRVLVLFAGLAWSYSLCRRNQCHAV